MKYVLFFIGLSVLFTSCEKHKERKAYKELWGAYKTESFVIYQDDSYYVQADVMGLNEEGVGFSLSDDNAEYGCEFSLLENDNESYDYKLSFDRLRLFILNVNTGEFIEQPSPSKSELNQGRLFYLQRSGNGKLTLVIVNIYDGSISTQLFIKTQQ